MIPAENHQATGTSWRQAARSDRPPILIVPGLFNSSPGHWQCQWEQALPDAERVDQFDWERPTLGEWKTGLAEAVRRRPGSVLIAHSSAAPSWRTSRG